MCACANGAVLKRRCRNMGITDFVSKHKPKHLTPVLLAALVWIGTPFLITLDEGFTNLAEKTNLTSYDFIQPWIKSTLVALTALGAFMDRAIERRRQKLDTEFTPRPKP